jgi:ABC-type antimicrobial peptide transport system permease subunit
VGVLLALGMAAVMRSELFGLNPLDPVSFGLPLLVLLGVVLLASLVPARRASGIQPVDALRWE